MRRSGLGRVVWAVVAVLCAVMVLPAARADVTLPAIMGSGMVLQREMKAPVWGMAEPGEKVTVKIGKFTEIAVADAKGRWSVKVGPFAVEDAPLQMAIEGKNTLVLKDILVGEVWVCSGQSNMEWMVMHSTGAAEEAPAAKYPNIRFFRMPNLTPSPTAQFAGKGAWVECSPATVQGFSAVAYYFGRDLHKALDMPVGLIQCTLGGSFAEGWMPPEPMSADADLKPIIDRYEAALPVYPEARKKYDADLAAWTLAAEQAKAEGKPLPPRPQMPMGPEHRDAPGGLFNAMVMPIAGYGIRGVIWYQGESNAQRGCQYRKLFAALIGSWRKQWGQGDFPFLFVQLSNYMQPTPEPVSGFWPDIREAQALALKLPNTAMAVAIDVGEAKDIHPPRKIEVGHRLALAAQATVYGAKIEYSGPLFDKMKIEAGKARISFTHVGTGLMSKGDGPLTGFAIAGADQKWVAADAVIAGNEVVVSSAQVPQPVAVRYAWANNPACNLYNKEELPAAPFRTDEWALATEKAR